MLLCLFVCLFVVFSAKEDSADALVNIAYAHEHVDFVIKYKNEARFLPIRAAWERAALKRGLFLDHESAVDEQEAFIKVYVPFKVLAAEAEERNISLPLLVSFLDKKKKKKSLFYFFYLQCFKGSLCLFRNRKRLSRGSPQRRTSSSRR